MHTAVWAQARERPFAGGARGGLRVGGCPDPWNLMQLVLPQESAKPAPVMRVFCAPGGVMRVVVNGSPVVCEEGTSLYGLVVQLGFKPEAVVAERNRELVPARDFARIRLKEGDRLELLHFVGGG